MSRGKSKSVVRKVNPDPIYGSRIISKLTAVMMLDGKKSIATKIVYKAIDQIADKIFQIHNEDNQGDDSEKKTESQKIVWFMENILGRIVSNVEVRSKRIGVSNYRIPVPVSKVRAINGGLKRIVRGARKRKEKSMDQKLAAELISIFNGTGETIKMKEALQKDIEANKAFAHYAR